MKTEPQMRNKKRYNFDWLLQILDHIVFWDHIKNVFCFVCVKNGFNVLLFFWHLFQWCFAVMLDTNILSILFMAVRNRALVSYVSVLANDCVFQCLVISTKKSPKILSTLDFLLRIDFEIIRRKCLNILRIEELFLLLRKTFETFCKISNILSTLRKNSESHPNRCN